MQKTMMTTKTTSNLMRKSRLMSRKHGERKRMFRSRSEEDTSGDEAEDHNDDDNDDDDDEEEEDDGDKEGDNDENQPMDPSKVAQVQKL